MKTWMIGVVGVVAGFVMTEPFVSLTESTDGHWLFSDKVRLTMVPR